MGECVHLDSKGFTGHICLGGPYYHIIVRGKAWNFEIRYSCGLCWLNLDGTGRMSDVPKYVWNAIDEWQRLGSRVEDEECIWSE